MIELVYELKSVPQDYRYLVSELGWRVSDPFKYGKPIGDFVDPIIRYETLEEDLASEQELIDTDDNGDLERAQSRYTAGVGDCANVLNFVVAPVFSTRARTELADVLEATGQLFPISVDGNPFFLYNCTRLITPFDDERCEVRYGNSSFGGQRPAEITRFAFRRDGIEDESLFKVQWPTPPISLQTVDYSIIPPPLAIFATQRFVDLVVKRKLTGFYFNPVAEVE